MWAGTNGLMEGIAIGTPAVAIDKPEPPEVDDCEDF
jgi:hypothetical protein